MKGVIILVNNLFNKKKIILFLTDALVIFLSYLSSYYFINPFHFKAYLANSLVAAISYGVIFYIFGIYNQIIRYSSVREYFKCGLATLFCTLLLACSSMLTTNYILDVKYQLFSGILILVGVIAYRVVIRNYNNFFSFLLNRKDNTVVESPKKVLIIGAGEAANLVIKDILKNHSKKYYVSGIIDDDKNKIGFTLCGIKILGDRNKIVHICEEKNIDLILLAIPSITSEDKKSIIDICHQTGKKVKVLPGINDWISKKSILSNMRDIDVTDLLYRDPVNLDDKSIKNYISEKTVMVTGGGGSIGSELCRQIAKFSPKHLIILDIYENNAYDIEYELNTYYKELKKTIIIASVRDRKRLEDVFSKYRPEIVFHAAAHKHVPLMEFNSCEAIKNNVFGTLNVAECADIFKAEKFILISTDKAVNPTNVMGASKRMCEMIIQAIDKNSETDFAAVRFGNVLGSNGSVIPLFKKQILDGGPVTVTHKDITRFFMTIPEAAQLVLQAGTFAHGGEIFVLDMGSPVKIYDLAVNMIKLSGLVPDKDIEIKISGLRPGEKLYEELLMSEEGLQSTENSKIFIAKPMEIDYNNLKEKLINLLETASNPEYDRECLKKDIKAIVPTYKYEISEI